MNEVKKAFSNTSDNNYFLSLYRDHFFQNFQAYSIFNKAPYPSLDEVLKRSISVPDPDMSKKEVPHVKTLIFDLDETLIHCTDAQKKKGEIY